MLKQYLTNPLFLMGLLLRVAMIGLVFPAAEQQWYLPFMQVSLETPSLDPWNAFREAGGGLDAFPYGYVMWLVLLPLAALCHGLNLPLHFGYGATVMLADIGLFWVLQRLWPDHRRSIVSAYWLSPIVLGATYWLGLNDLIPVFLLVLALYLVRHHRMRWAGVLCGTAISAKLSMLLAIPFFVIYLYQNRSLRTLLPKYLQGLAPTLFVLCLPTAFSAAGWQMLLGNPELAKGYQFALQIGKGKELYMLPFAYLLMLYVTWRVRRPNFDLFHTLFGVAFMLVLLLTPAAPGWFIWVMPVLVFHQINNPSYGRHLVTAFGVLFIINILLTAPLPLVQGIPLTPWREQLPSLTLMGGLDLASSFHTMLTVVGVVLVASIWYQAVATNDYFRLSRKPFVIGIAGDSGAGKDTLADALRGLFGHHSVTSLSGDDYHLWDRHKPMWQVMTHLNPMANDLDGYANDLTALINGRSILNRHYDHETGKMSLLQPVASNDFIIASGLHALYLPILRECYDLSIYLDIDEDLRRHFKLRRDVTLRGHSQQKVLSALNRREPDAMKFVRPQARHADLIMTLQPINREHLESDSFETPHPRLKLLVRAHSGFNELSLLRVLVGVCGLHVDMDTEDNTGLIEVSIEGEVDAEDIALAADILVPRVREFLDIRPQWEGGVLGLMQLVTLAHINQALNKRLL